MSDGSVVLETRIDTSGIVAGAKQIENATSKISSKAIIKLQQEFDILNAKIAESAAKYEEASAKYAEFLQNNKFESGVPGVNTPNGVVFQDPVAQEQFMQLYNELNSLYDAMIKDQDAMSGLEAKARTLGYQFQNTANDTTGLRDNLSDVDNKIDNTSGDIKNLGNQIERTEEEAEDAPSILDRIGDAANRLGKRIFRLTTRVLFFSVITKVLRRVREAISNVFMSNEEFRDSLYRLRAALWTAFAPIMQFIVPAIKTLIDWLAIAISTITRSIGLLFGKTYKDLTDNAKSLKSQADNYKNVSKSAESAAKGMKKVTDEAKKQLAAFDELNILTDEKNESGGGGASAGTEDIFNSGEIPDFVSEIGDQLAQIMEIVGGALVALGLILLFTGNVGWGIGAIIAGFTVFSVAERKLGRFGTEEIITTLARLGQIVGSALAVIGVILLMAGQYGLGIGAIISGIAAFQVSEAQLQRDGIKTEIDNFLKENEGLLVGIAAAMLILGVVILALCPGKFFSVGLGLLLGGVSIMAAEISTKEGTIGEKIAAFLKDNAALLVGVAAAALILGIVILIFTKKLTWGIPLILLGATILVAEAVLHKDEIHKAIDNFIKDNIGLIVGVAAAMVVLGIILLFSPQTLPLALGLLAAGGLLIWKAIAPNWGFLLEKLKETWEKIKAWWKEKIAPIFTADWWLNLAKGAANGLIDGFEKAINGIITMFEKMVNWIVGGINSLGFDIPDFLGGGHVGFNIQKVSFGRVKIPRLAAGGIVPRATLAQIGEQGREAVLPLENNTEWMDMLAERLAAQLGGGTPVVLAVDGREFGRTVVRLGNQQIRMTGTSFVER